MELSLHRKHAGNLVHFHVCMTDSERSHRCRVAEDFIWAGSRPNVVYGFKVPNRSSRQQRRRHAWGGTWIFDDAITLSDCGSRVQIDAPQSKVLAR